MNKNVKITSERLYGFVEDEVKIQVSDTKNGFALRLIINDKKSNWESDYASILTLVSPKSGIMYGYATQYWTGIFPTETVIQIRTGLPLF